MRHDIPSRWLTRVQQYVRQRTGEERDHLSAYDFPGGRSVRIDFPDGSFALFRYAFCLCDETLGEIAVFTEHCGYFFFPAEDLRVETLETVWKEGGEGQDVDRDP